jgi:hypothetical protein
MRAVWSFWTPPYNGGRGFSWQQDRHHCLSWIVSVGVATQHFESTALHTDDAGATLLIDQLGLPFDHVSTSLNELHAADPDWWMQGKLHTYARQQEPFVHLDNDVYLFKSLPERLTSAPVLAQNPEPVNAFAPWYDVEACELAIRTRGDGQIPPEWTWYRTFVMEQQAACCGIFGGNHLDFIHHYASTALRLLRGNRHAFDHLSGKRTLNPFFEQYLLAACARFHKVPIEYLFHSFEHAINTAAGAGFTHLIADAKRDLNMAARLEQRVARAWPEAYARWQAMFEPERKQA